MDTKEKILITALRQFNALGTDAVTVRSIAQEAGISHGNLCYHFPNTDAIIVALYQRVVAEMDEQANRALYTLPEVGLMLGIGELGFHILYRYKFLMLDLVRITRRIPLIQEAYRSLMHIRRQQFAQLFRAMADQSWLLPEPFTGFYEHFAAHQLVFADGWIAHAEIHFSGPPEAAVSYYYKSFVAGLLPLLTEQGRAVYVQMLHSEPVNHHFE